MNDIRIREITKNEIELFVEWLYAHKDVNRMDLDVFRKNQAQIFCAYDETGILAFFPVQFLYYLGALSPRPDLAPFRLAKACQAMTEFMHKKAAEDNISHAIVHPSDDKFSAFLQSDALGYEKLEQETLVMTFDKSETACAR